MGGVGDGKYGAGKYGAGKYGAITEIDGEILHESNTGCLSHGIIRSDFFSNALRPAYTCKEKPAYTSKRSTLKKIY